MDQGFIIWLKHYVSVNWTKVLTKFHMPRHINLRHSNMIYVDMLLVDLGVVDIVRNQTV